MHRTVSITILIWALIFGCKVAQAQGQYLQPQYQPPQSMCPCQSMAENAVEEVINEAVAVCMRNFGVANNVRERLEQYHNWGISQYMAACSQATDCQQANESLSLQLSGSSGKLIHDTGGCGGTAYDGPPQYGPGPLMAGPPGGPVSANPEPGTGPMPPMAGPPGGYNIDPPVPPKVWEDPDGEKCGMH